MKQSYSRSPEVRDAISASMKRRWEERHQRAALARFAVDEAFRLAEQVMQLTPDTPADEAEALHAAAMQAIATARQLTGEA